MTRKHKVIVFSVVAAAVTCLAVVGTILLCGKQDPPAPEEPEFIAYDAPGVGQGAIHATVEEIYEDYVIVKCYEVLSGPFLCGDRVKVSKHNISSVPVPDMKVNDTIRVLSYSGVNKEDDLLVPGQIISIFLVDDKGEVIDWKE